MKVLLVQLDTAAHSILCAIVRDLTDDLHVLEATDVAAVSAHLRNHPDMDLLVTDLHAARFGSGAGSDGIFAEYGSSLGDS